MFVRADLPPRPPAGAPAAGGEAKPEGVPWRLPFSEEAAAFVPFRPSAGGTRPSTVLGAVGFSGVP